MKCPICGLIVAHPASLCACGYEPATGDPQNAIAKLARAKLDAHWTMAVGVAIAAASPLLYLLIGETVFGVVLALLQVIAGASFLGSGVRSLVRVQGRLRAARALRELPAARLLP